jgi:hypothetical protein
MIIRDTDDSPHERVLDRSMLCELLHPNRLARAEELECSVAHAIIPPGESTLPHLLKKSTELYCILKGSVAMHIDKETAPVIMVRTTFLMAKGVMLRVSLLLFIGVSNICRYSNPWIPLSSSQLLVVMFSLPGMPKG